MSAEMSAIQVSIWMLALLFTAFLVSAQPEDLQENCQGDHRENCHMNNDENHQETSHEDDQEILTTDDSESDYLAKYPGMFLSQQEIDAFNENINKDVRTHFREKIYSACCEIVSELTKFDVAEDTRGNKVRIFQPPGVDHFQVFQDDTTCNTVENCRCGCRCAKVKRLYFAIVRKLDSNRIYPDYVYIPTVCRCINNLPERTEL